MFDVLDMADSAIAPLKAKRVTIQDEYGIILVIDATRAEAHSYKAQATVHEVEDGEEITDHIVKQGITLSIDGVISDDPISLLSAIIGNTAGIAGSLIDGPLGAVTTGVLGFAGNSLLSGNLLFDSNTPSIEAFQALTALYQWQRAVTIITGLDTYVNMVMESLDIPRNAATGAALEFSASFRKIRIAQSETVDIPAAAQEPNVDGNKKVSQGNKAPKKPSAAAKGKGESWLHSIAGGLFK